MEKSPLSESCEFEGGGYDNAYTGSVLDATISSFVEARILISIERAGCCAELSALVSDKKIHHSSKRAEITLGGCKEAVPQVLPADPGTYSARVQRRSAPSVVPPQGTFWGRRRWGRSCQRCVESPPRGSSHLPSGVEIAALG